VLGIDPICVFAFIFSLSSKTMSFRVIPVLDLKDGRVVHGIAGRRHEYQPIQSRLTTSTKPGDVARAIRDHYGLNEIYLADLNAIAGVEPAFSLFAELNAAGFQLWVDAGIHHCQQAESLLQAGVQTIVLGLETLAGPDTLAKICASHSDRVIFSLDMNQGKPLGNRKAWGDGDAWTIAQTAWESGARRILLLDLSRVGVNQGIGTEELAIGLLTRHPGLDLTVGGGIRHCDDLLHLKGLGVSGALVATALHKQTILLEHLDRVIGR
jgi:phosphoribosylformimino-5-aminoimidazole carboxamide ribotide isomerase